MEDMSYGDYMRSNPPMPYAIVVTITTHTGNLVKYDRNNDGTRDLLDVPYREKWKHAKFRIPSNKLPKGKPKCERFSADLTDEAILEAVAKKYSNFRFTINL